ncbi:MAG: FAD-binding oxidoreductase [Halofilum sp. (in: g-proteobacteria)]|nr:FAD-binding oxidoreductase [Halofilum sp. (in: g-proteobacteria)]
MASDSCDVCIAGGGIVGSATAYFLAADPAFDGRVVVLEPDPGYRLAATARSAGSVRQQFSTPLNIAISQFAVRFLRNIERYLAVDGEVPAIGFHEGGYLFLADEEGVEARRAEYATAVGCGAEVTWLTPAELGERFPWLDTVGLEGGTLGLSGEGWLDPWALLQAFRAKARALGVEYRRERVAAVEVEAGRVAGVRGGDGARLACGWLVDAAGIGSREVAALAGVDLPVYPRKRFVFVFDAQEPAPGLPLTVLPEGVYVRPEGSHYITGCSPAPEADRDCDDLEVDYTVFDEVLWPALAARMRPFEGIRMINAWAGHYDVHPLDHNAILGPHPQRPNLLLASGFSGHGLQQAPAVGRGLAEQVVHGGWRSLDLSPLGYERVLAGRPLSEGKVV